MNTLQEKLAHAEREYHKLITGVKPKVVVDRNGERVEFNSANAGKLLQYIHSLRSQLGMSSVRRPMGVRG